MPPQNAEGPIAVSVLVRRRARLGCEQQLQDWAVALCADADAMPGHLASKCFRPPVEVHGELLLGMTFASARDLLTWNDSPERISRLSTVTDLTEGVADAVPVDMLVGTLPITDSEPAAPRAVSRWMSAFVVWLAIYPSSLAIAALVGPVLDASHIALRTLVTTSFIVPFMVYIAVPLLQRLLAPWLRRWT